MEGKRKGWITLVLALALTLLPCFLLAQNTSSSPKTKININTATVEELQALPGVGPTIAQRIVEYRQAYGPFQKVEDLLNIKGIGEKKLEKIKPLVEVVPPEK